MQKKQSTSLYVSMLFGVLATPAIASGSAFESKDFVKEGLFTKGIEGPAVDGSGLLYAVNFGKEGTIGVIDSSGKAQHYIDLPKGSTGNGIRFGRDGSMYIADYTGHNVLKVDPDKKSISVHSHNGNMNQPNDIAISDSGVIYASDPNWSKSTGQLWMVKTDGKSVLLEKGMGTTNGIEVSPGGDKLYVNESVQRKVWVYDILANGSVSNKKLFHHFKDHGLDGMRCDAEGNLYIARYGAGKIAVLSPEGKLKQQVKLTGKHPTNVAFGGKDGKTVFVTMQQRQAVETFDVNIPGRSYNLMFND